MGLWSKFIEKKLLAPGSNIFKKFYLIRKVYLTNLFRTFHAQFGEDIVLKGFLLKNISDGFFVDVGCFHPRKYNNTYKLYKKGWRGINIDLDELKIQAFKMLRPEDCNVLAAVSDKESTVTVYDFDFFSVISTVDEEVAQKSENKIKWEKEIKTQTLSSIIDSSRFAGRQIDVLSVDVEGHDLNVLKSLDFEKYHPKIILVESHLMNIDLIMKSDLFLFLKEKGYDFINWVGLTLFFVYPNNDILSLWFNADLSAGAGQAKSDIKSF